LPRLKLVLANARNKKPARNGGLFCLHTIVQKYYSPSLVRFQNSPLTSYD
jgi:hypothetical protein